ncbi:MAG: hypothetical protein ACREYE_06120 [Gammaproteobacteria bacterium]
MSETIAITGKSVKLFKGHYTRSLRTGHPERHCLVQAQADGGQSSALGLLFCPCFAQERYTWHAGSPCRPSFAKGGRGAAPESCWPESAWGERGPWTPLSSPVSPIRDRPPRCAARP